MRAERRPGRRTAALACALVIGLGAACAPAGPRTVTLMTHDSFAVSDHLFADFEREHGIRVEVLRAGDAGAMVNQAILTRENPLADVLFGVDNTFLSRALEAGIFVPYSSPALADVPEQLRLDDQARVTPIDHGEVCLNIDRAAFAERPPPTRLEDLTHAAFADTLVVQNPATSSPGLAFLLATIVRFGEDGDYTWRDYWRDLRANGVQVTAGWEDAYYGAFSGGAGAGDRPIVVSYASSPAAEVVFAEEPPDEAPTAVVADGCFRQVEFAGILAGTDAEADARVLVDFMLSPAFQQDIPLNMFVYPANATVELPVVFEQHAPPIADPIVMAPAAIANDRERWIQEWTDVVLR
ncbi:MAG TPA: thiamine ABC transporter substrate-binding protein [Candidatus Limnocylindria bacterium]|jgi:thiamine transport system substrate-binding protein|nr:thiamine ABC transporter substrate-binding protein [Candidatus Limnocylindria bacterium]